MPVSQHLGEVSVLTETNESLIFGYHSSSKTVKFYSVGTPEYVPLKCYIQSNKDSCVKGEIYPLCDESNRVFYYDNNCINFNKGKSVVVRYGSKWDIGYLEGEEFVLFKFTKVTVSTDVDKIFVPICHSPVPLPEETKPWYNSRWLWIIGSILLILLILLVIIFIVKKAKVKKCINPCTSDSCDISMEPSHLNNYV